MAFSLEARDIESAMQNGRLLREQIEAHFKARGREVTLATSIPATRSARAPREHRGRLIVRPVGRHAVHAAMAGKTALVVSFFHGHFVHAPIGLIAQGSKRLDLDGELHRGVRSSTTPAHGS